MRRPLVAAALVTAALAAVAATTATSAKAPTAVVPPAITALDKQFRAIVPAARCAAGAPQLARGRATRAKALTRARGAKGRVLAAKKAHLRAAIASAKRARAACRAAAVTPPGTPAGAPAPPAPAAPAPGAPAPAPPPPPVDRGTVVAVGIGDTPISFDKPSYTAPAGIVTLRLANSSDLDHNVGARTAPDAPALGSAPSVGLGGATEVTVTLPAGTYQVFCNVLGHDQLGMTAALTIT